MVIQPLCLSGGLHCDNIADYRESSSQSAHMLGPGVCVQAVVPDLVIGKFLLATWLFFITLDHVVSETWSFL